jgi:hypothetical protein
MPRRLLVPALLAFAAPALAQHADLHVCLDHVVPYTPGQPVYADSAFGLLLDGPGGALHYVGAEHSSDPGHAQFAAIEAAFAAFRPTVVFYEGPERPLEETAEGTIRSFGESGYARFLARAAGVPVARLEPDPAEEFGAVGGTVGMEQGTLFFVLREAARLRDRRGLTGAELDAAIASLLERAAAVGLPVASLDSLEAAYHRHFTTPADWRDAPAAWFDPFADDAATGGQFMAAANRASSDFRNRHMTRVLAAAARGGGRVFAVVGRNHVPMQAAALRCALAPSP